MTTLSSLFSFQTPADTSNIYYTERLRLAPEYYMGSNTHIYIPRTHTADDGTRELESTVYYCILSTDRLTTETVGSTTDNCNNSKIR